MNAAAASLRPIRVLLAKLGLEALEGLRASNDKAHLQMQRDHDKQIDLLKSLGVHVRKRVERLERPKRRS